MRIILYMLFGVGGILVALALGVVFFTDDEIAKVVGVSVGTVRSRLFYARRQLQADLGEYVK